MAVCWAEVMPESKQLLVPVTLPQLVDNLGRRQQTPVSYYYFCQLQDHRGVTMLTATFMLIKPPLYSLSSSIWYYFQADLSSRPEQFPVDFGFCFHNLECKHSHGRCRKPQILWEHGTKYRITNNFLQVVWKMMLPLAILREDTGVSAWHPLGRAVCIISCRSCDGTTWSMERFSFTCTCRAGSPSLSKDDTDTASSDVRFRQRTPTTMGHKGIFSHTLPYLILDQCISNV